MEEKKHIRLVLDFTIDISDAQLSTRDKKQREYNERQRRLLQAILSKEEWLDTYLRLELASFLEYMSEREWHELLMGEDHRDSKGMLAPIIATLSQEDQRFFEDAEKDGVFYENIEMVDACFSTEMESVKVVNLQPFEGQSEEEGKNEGDKQ